MNVGIGTPASAPAPTSASRVVSKETERAGDLVQTARELVPFLKAQAGETENLGRLSDKSAAALRDAGFLSLFAPRRLGGHQSGLEAATQVFAQLGRCCGASAWVAMLLSGGSFLASLLGDQVRREVWQDDPCTAVCGGFGMAQKARWAPGGLVVGGRWQPLTGVHQAQ